MWIRYEIFFWCLPKKRACNLKFMEWLEANVLKEYFKYFPVYLSLQFSSYGPTSCCSSAWDLAGRSIWCNSKSSGPAYVLTGGMLPFVGFPGGLNIQHTSSSLGKGERAQLRERQRDRKWRARSAAITLRRWTPPAGRARSSTASAGSRPTSWAPMSPRPPSSSSPTSSVIADLLF